MGAPIRFLFDNDFATPPPEVVAVSEEDQEEEVPKIELEIHLEEMRKADAAAYERGLQDGLRSVEAEAHQQVAQEARRLADAADKMITMVDADLRRIEVEATILCVAIAKKISGFALDNYPHIQVMSLVEECLAPLRDVRHLAIRVNEMDVEKLKQPIESLAAKSGFEGRLLILGEPETRPGDCRIEWADGGVVFERNAILASVDAAIRTYLGPAAAEYDIATGLDEGNAVEAGPGDVGAVGGQEDPNDIIPHDEPADGPLAADTDSVETIRDVIDGELSSNEPGLEENGPERNGPEENGADEARVETARDDEPDAEGEIAADLAEVDMAQTDMAQPDMAETDVTETDMAETGMAETDTAESVTGPDAATRNEATPDDSDPAVVAGDATSPDDRNEDDLTLEASGTEDVDQVDMGAEEGRPGDKSNE